MQSYTTLVLEQGMLGVISAIIPAIAYWFTNLNISPSKRVKLISPFLVIVTSFVIVAIISSYTTLANYEPYWWTYQLTLLVAVTAVIFSVKLHNGNKFIHISHVFTLFSASYLWLVGGMALSHDWL